MMIAVRIIITLYLCFPSACDGTETKVFTFLNDSPDNEELSSVTLTNAPENPLPDNFLICSSHTQQQKDTLNTRTIYVLYEDPNFTKPWFSIGFWYTFNLHLYANTRYLDWYDLGHVTLETFLNWIHICVELDTVNATLRASINGGNVTAVSYVKGLTPVPKLYLRLGVVHQSDDRGQFQFYGSVSNINIFSLQNRAKDNFFLKQSACKFNESSFLLSWTNSEWRIVGKGMEEEVFDKKSICLKSTSINFRISLQWTKIEASEECRKYGPNGNISKPMNIVDMYKDFSTFKPCRFFWTPYTDKYTEGRYVDENSNETMNEIQWQPGQPDGGILENFVGFRPPIKTFNDLPNGRKECVSCEISRSTAFTMRGACENSYLETIYFPTICRGYIGFIGNMIFIW